MPEKRNEGTELSAKSRSLIMRPLNFLYQRHSFPTYGLIIYLLMIACLPMFAYGMQPYNYEIVKIIVLAVLTIYSGFFAVLIWIDITDTMGALSRDF